MATSKFYLDKRNPKADGSCPLKLVISHKHASRLIKLNVYLKPDEWDDRSMTVIKRNDRTFLNSYIVNRKQEVDEILLNLRKELPKMTIAQLKERIEYELTPEDLRQVDETQLVAYNFQKFADQHTSNTKEIYMGTYRHIQKFMGDKLDNFTFEEITREWLTDFDKYLARTSPAKNARNIHLRNIRAVVNDAIDNGITTNYPFRKFKIKPEETLKRSLDIEELRTLFNYPVDARQQQYLDMFKLIFYLCGINIVDLYGLTEIKKGRVEYKRSKTHKPYSIKVEPEAKEIIEKYKGQKALLNIADRYTNYKDYRHRLNENLQRIGKVERKGRGGKKVFTPLFPELTSYWARHTWATIAAELDIPNETIAAALGHEFGNRTTAIYIRFDQKKVDEANRKVIDYVLYEKK